MQKSLLFAAAAVVTVCATAQDDGTAMRGETRERIAVIVRDAPADGKANHPANRCRAVIQNAGTGEIICAESVGGGTP